MVCAYSAAQAQQGAVKIYTTSDSDFIYKFKIVQTKDITLKSIGIITTYLNSSYSYYPTTNNLIIYYPYQKQFKIINQMNCQSVYCDVDYGYTDICQGMSWYDISPNNDSITMYSTWYENPCGPRGDNDNPWGSAYNLYYKGCNLQNESDMWVSITPRPYGKQDLFFNPKSDTEIYYFNINDPYNTSNVSGLYFSHFSDTCPSNWLLLKAEPNFSYFYIPPDFPNILFFTANDTLWQSPDPIAYWNTAITVNITSISYFPDGKFFYALCSDSVGKGLYRSGDSGQTFIQLDKSLFYSIAVDTTNGAVYAGGKGVLYRSDDSGKTFYTYNNTFTNEPIISIAANVYGELICAVSNGLYQITNSSVAPLLVSPKNDSMWVQQYSTFKWNNIPEASSYLVQIATDSLFTNIVLDYKNVTDSMKQLDSLQPLTRYYWRVLATLNSPATSIWSQTWQFVTMPLLPTQIVLESPANDTILFDTRVSFSWAQAQYIPTNYLFEIAGNDSLGNPIIDSNVVDTSTVLYEPLIPHAYWWRVKAKNVEGWGTFSPTYHFSMLQESNVVENISSPSDWDIIIYPNPFTQSAFIQINSNEKIISLKIYDELNREVKDLSGECNAGLISLNGNGLPSGVYICRVQFASRITQKLMILMK